ncbi:TPM domain-containing protein [Gilliamella sp. B2776]|uniref:TPM domain-containing protein n=1 Tax=unclassified Gilliamella TaxID=2685620 RepID=UPI002269A4E8|nr:MULTISPECIES: TPM domain-containing protein [unclassified Gilliamella]MCX8650352.1 TPM domain-containing protein [Gilliamella sp. B2779]MCX8654675.1 TPM domain-containing protein [Gilliamella sp. B2737]MCX8692125.1 TPM domain-containing protein [Gilliamella sp. B2776]MCX8703342.1 TPM domain-containing protein [Gilliamella sp. B2781]WDM17744.1 TPM domain-containing protein [Gilliamella sp. B3022]
MKNYFLLSFLLMFSWLSYGLTDIPSFNQRVIDTTNTLTSSQVNTLESSLLEFEKPRTDGAQIAVLMIAKLDNETIEQYADRVFIQWKIGKKGLDNGILLLIVKDDKLMRIEVGYGFEGTITDLVANHIIREQLVPQFKQNNYYQGIDNALSVLKEKIDTSASDFGDEKEQNLNTLLASEFGSQLINYGLVSFFMCFFIANLLFNKVSAKRSLGTGLLNGLSVGGFTLWHGYPINMVLPVLFLAFVTSTILSGILSAGGRNGGSNNRRGGGGFGGFGGGSGGGFGGGGGGRSGGGGASGSW